MERRGKGACHRCTLTKGQRNVSHAYRYA
jgi:hypothetical protein